MDTQPNTRDDNSNPPRATDAEDERWVGEGGGSAPSTHGAGNDGRDDVSPSTADQTAADRAPPSLDEGEPKSTSDGSGTSETD